MGGLLNILICLPVSIWNTKKKSLFVTRPICFKITFQQRELQADFKLNQGSFGAKILISYLLIMNIYILTFLNSIPNKEKGIYVWIKKKKKYFSQNRNLWILAGSKTEINRPPYLLFTWDEPGFSPVVLTWVWLLSDYTVLDSPVSEHRPILIPFETLT